MAFASTLPDDWRMRGTHAKYLLKRAMAPLLPASIVSRRKVGFSMPIQLWLRTTMSYMVGDLLLGADSVVGSLLDRRQLAASIDEHRRGLSREKLLWMLLNLELWIRTRGLRL